MAQRRGSTEKSALPIEDNEDNEDNEANERGVTIESLTGDAAHHTPSRYRDRVVERYREYYTELDLPVDTVRTAVDVYVTLQRTRRGGDGEDESSGGVLRVGYDVVIAATVTIGTRVQNTPRTLDEISGVHGVDRGEMMRANHRIQDACGVYTTPIPPGEYLDRIQSEYTLPERVTVTATRALDAVRGDGSNPAVAAAGAVWVAVKQHGYDEVVQRELAAMIGCSGAAIQDAVQRIEDA